MSNKILHIKKSGHRLRLLKYVIQKRKTVPCIQKYYKASLPGHVVCTIENMKCLKNTFT